jgi:glycosyltransferase involved in cell wall biosynthesis
MKIVYYYRGLPSGTALVNMTEMITALRDLGHTVIPCFPVNPAGKVGGEAGPIARWRNCVPRVMWNLGQLGADRWAASALLSLCRSERPDLIHERYVPFSLAASAIAKRMGITLITIAHEFPAHQMPENFSPLVRWLARCWERKALQRADKVLVVSTPLREWLVANLLPENRVAVMPNGVRADAFEDLSDARTSRRAQLGLGPDDIALGYLQRWEPNPVNKAAEEILRRLMGRLPAPHCRLVLVGGGSQFDNVRRRMTEDPHVGERAEFVGSVPHDEVPGYLAAFDVGLVPTHASFTSPMKLFEYMAAGTAVVAPALPNIGEIIRDGETGLLFPPGDVEALSQVVARLISNPDERRRLGEAARRDVLAKYTWHANAERLVNMTQELAARRQR